ncbi:MAG: PEP/pyruvate-binding domain-containing protein [Desulfobacterales bacterium]|jgi:pyruvate,water dikinase
MVTQYQFILGFEECDKDSLPIVGGKNANLGEMVGAGLRVPPGFALTSKAFQFYMESEHLWETVLDALADIAADKITAVAEAGSYIRNAILSRPIPEVIESEVVAAYNSLCDRCGEPKLPVAVRSSATAEDLAEASFAGQQDTFLWVRGAAEVLKATLGCWASLFTDRAITYRARVGFPQDEVLISVGIQKMVNAKCAGVMFTLDPVTGNSSKITIDANWGFGESIVQGMVCPDSFTIRKNPLEIEQCTVGQKDQCVVPRECGTAVECVPSEQQDILCLNDEEIIELAKMGMRIEGHYGAPQDIEWAIDKDLPFPENAFTTQSRPVTAAGKKSFDDKLVKEDEKNDTDHIIDLMLKGFGQ